MIIIIIIIITLYISCLLQAIVRVDNVHELSVIVRDEVNTIKYDWEATEEDTLTMVGRQCIKCEQGKVRKSLLFY